MDAEAIDIPQRSRDAARPKEVHQRVDSLRVVLVEIPKHGIVGHIGLRVPLVAPIHGRELDRISDEEDGQVIEDKILDALLRVELGRPAPDIADRVAGALFATNGRDASQDLGLLPDTREELCIGQIRHIFKHLKLAKGAGGLCVHAPVKRKDELFASIVFFFYKF